jgi:hypothetical protein
MNTNWQRQDVDPDDIVVDTRFQSRVQLDEATVEEYAQAMRDGTDFPPINVARIDGKIYLLDGFHRFEAAKRANGLFPFESIFMDAYVVDCTEDEALEISLTFNTAHGLRRSNDDKRKAVRIALKLSELRFLSDRDLAKRLSVSPPFVAKMRAEIATAKNKPAPTFDSHNMVNQEGVKTFSPEENSHSGGHQEPVSSATTGIEDDFDERDLIIEELTKENQALQNRLGDKAFIGTEEEKSLLQSTVDELRSDLAEAHDALNLANRQVSTIAISRDTYMNENADLKGQVKYWERRVKKLERICSDHGIDEKIWNGNSISR